MQRKPQHGQLGRRNGCSWRRDIQSDLSVFCCLAPGVVRRSTLWTELAEQSAIIGRIGAVVWWEIGRRVSRMNQLFGELRLNWGFTGGPGWFRTSDLPRVRRTLSP